MHTFSQILDRIISNTAWKMIPPKAYGGFHLIFTLVGVLLSVLLAYRFRHLGERGNRRLLVSVGVFLMLTEVYISRQIETGDSTTFFCRIRNIQMDESLQCEDIFDVDLTKLDPVIYSGRYHSLGESLGKIGDYL